MLPKLQAAHDKWSGAAHLMRTVHTQCTTVMTKMLFAIKTNSTTDDRLEAALKKFRRLLTLSW